jgi:hypothetical protein
VSQRGPGRVRPEPRRLADWWCPGHAPAQDAKWPTVGNRVIQAALGDQYLRGVLLDAGDRAQQLDDVSVRGKHEFDPLAQVLQRSVQRVDVREQLGDHNPVVLDLKATPERLAQLRDLRPHLAFGELSELLGIGDA